MAIKHRVRLDGKGKTGIKDFTARKAIQHHCRECMGFQPYEVKYCLDPLCALYPFRLTSKPEGVT